MTIIKISPHTIFSYIQGSNNFFLKNIVVILNIGTVSQYSESLRCFCPKEVLGQTLVCTIAILPENCLGLLPFSKFNLFKFQDIQL